jgi:hypothetical protein
MSEECNRLLSELDGIAATARKTFGAFSAEQINWKPSAESWSVGQCFEHLIKTNELFYDELEKIARGARRNSFLENWSPLSGVFANLLIGSLKKDERKFKAPSPKIVPPSDIDAAIIEKFAAHQAELIEKIKECEAADWRKTVITSPFMKLMTYRLADGFTVVVEHEKRHFRQAERVANLENFPA